MIFSPAVYEIAAAVAEITLFSIAIPSPAVYVVSVAEITPLAILTLVPAV